VAEPIDILYISYNGIDEPLVQSQVVNYLQGLTQLGYRFALLTFERGKADTNNVARERLAELGIEWHGITAHRGWGALSSLLDVFRGTSAAMRVLERKPVRLVHARSFIPALIAWRLKRKRRLPFVNDLRGFWVDEKVYRGRLRENSVIYRVAKWLEARVLRASDHLVSLSARGAEALRDFAAWRGGAVAPIEVIPTCVDTDRFMPAPRESRGVQRFGYVGSLSAEYLPDQIFAYFAAARRRFPNSRLQLITRSEPGPIRALAAQFGLPPESFDLIALEPHEVPAAVAHFDVALSFIRPHFAKLASCPTKVGEYLAAGIPVVGNAGIGDMDALLADGKVGFLLRDFDAAKFEASFRHLEIICADPTLAGRCRDVALAQFSLREGVRRYDAMYLRVLRGDGQRC